MPQPTVTTLDDDLVRVTMPLPWALDHVHCYALAGADGWTLVDTGLGTDATLGWWREVLRGLGGPVCADRAHPLPPRPPGRERAAGRADRRRRGRPGPARPRAVGGGLGGGRRRRVRALPARPRHAGRRWRRRPRAPRWARRCIRPQPTRLVEEGDELEIGGERYRVLQLPGHADGHIALLGERSGRLLGGDVLLEEITPNVGRWPDTARDPLGRYLHTLGRVAELAPVTVLPGHGPVIDRRRRPRRRDRRAPCPAARPGRARGAGRRHHRLRRRPGDLARRAARLPRAAIRAGGGDLAPGAAGRAEGRISEPEPGRWRPSV